ncbi:hypothetical protein RFI_01402, partial [Reticulomyxa filosa]
TKDCIVPSVFRKKKSHKKCLFCIYAMQRKKEFSNRFFFVQIKIRILLFIESTAEKSKNIKKLTFVKLQAFIKYVTFFIIFCEEKIQVIVYNWGLSNSTKSCKLIYVILIITSKLINQRTSTSGALCKIFINFTIFVKIGKYVDCFVKGRAVEMVRNSSSYRKLTQKFKVSNACVIKLFLTFKKDFKILKNQLTGRPQKIPLRLHLIIVIYMITSKILYQ